MESDMGDILANVTQRTIWHNLTFKWKWLLCNNLQFVQGDNDNFPSHANDIMGYLMSMIKYE